jgi:hypothetical protein
MAMQVLLIVATLIQSYDNRCSLMCKLNQRSVRKHKDNCLRSFVRIYIYIYIYIYVHMHVCVPVSVPYKLFGSYGSYDVVSALCDV